jgi:mRNA-degrading endonuclease toxin of MazEF toxin-antitoxin module
VAREVRAFFSEYVNDPQSRDLWRRAQGLCPEHVSLLATLGDALAVAILYADLAERTRERWLGRGASAARHPLRSVLQRANGSGRPAAACPACEIAHAADARNAGALAQALTQDRAEVWEALEVGCGLCVAHTDQVASLASPAAATRLRRIEAQRLVALQAELEEIIRKNDYRFRGEPWGPERDAWLRALHKLKRPRT